jgi:hypothetical protein
MESMDFWIFWNDNVDGWQIARLGSPHIFFLLIVGRNDHEIIFKRPPVHSDCVSE